MLRNNNPDIDFDSLNARIDEELKRYKASGNAITLPEFELVEIEQPTIHIADVLALEDEAFIQQAYSLILRRPADPTGLEHYLGQLRAGTEKAQIICSLCLSPEGQPNAHLFAGLRKEVLKQKISRLPVVGPLVNTLLTLATAYPFRKHINARVNHFYRLAADHSALLADVQHNIARLLNDRLYQRKRIATLQDDLAKKDQCIAELQHNYGLQQQQIERQANIQLQQESMLLQLKMRTARLESSANTTTSVTASTDLTTSSNHPTTIDDGFYAAFEEHFRGDEETILQRLEYYVPLLKQYAVAARSDLLVADIGCGRGEWIGLLKQQGIEAIGIDLNEVNVSHCQQLGQQVLQADGLNWLADQADSSLALLTAFHVIEHLSFEQKNRLLEQALRVLAPGGLLILETPNPENIVIGATHFYTDPTHLHPLPPAFTEFLVNYKGFADVLIHRLNPVPAQFALDENFETARRCNNLFYGPQDYAVVAVKPAETH